MTTAHGRNPAETPAASCDTGDGKGEERNNHVVLAALLAKLYCLLTQSIALCLDFLGLSDKFLVLLLI
jgi:hypothetical protein